MENLLKGLQGQHVLITGAAGGIGFSCAELFLSLGAKVSLHYNSQKKTLESLLLQYPENAFALSVDASSEDAIEAGVRQSVQKFGFINVAVINHAFYELKAAPIWEMSLKQWQKTLDIDLTSYFLYSREWARQLKSHAADLNQQALAELNASLILIGSTAGKHGEAAHSDYSVCKSALHNGFLLSVKNELVQLAPFARVNVVAPGWTETPMAKEAIARGEHLKALNTQSMKKVASSQDIAMGCLYYAHQTLSKHVTGTVKMIDGGMEGRTQGKQH